MNKSITQDMAYRQSLMKYAEKYGVSRASRKYNRNRSYIYFWRARWDGSVESLACQSKRPHSHPNLFLSTPQGKLPGRPLTLLLCHHWLPVLIQQRGKTRRIAVPVKHIVDTCFRVNPDFHDINSSLAIDFLKTLHSDSPFFIFDG